MSHSCSSKKKKKKVHFEKYLAQETVICPWSILIPAGEQSQHTETQSPQRDKLQCFVPTFEGVRRRIWK